MITAFISGVFSGILFFGGLWFTIKKTLGTSYAALWLLISSFTRTIIVLAGFYFVAQGNWQRLVLAMAGFITARFFILWLTKSFDQRQALSTGTNQR